MRALCAVLALLAADGLPADPDLGAAATHTSAIEAGGVRVRWDPAAIPPERARAGADRAAAALRAVESALDQRLEAPPTLFLYRDAADLAARTGAPAAWGAFAHGDRSVHAPLGAPLRHEWTHLVARRFRGAGRDPGGLLREGLAAAMEGSDRGIAVGDWAAVERRLGLLAPLADLRLRWPAGPPACAHPDHAAGAFARWLLDARGLAALKALYAAPGDAEAAAGASWEGLERAWHAALDARAVPEGDEAAVRKWFGLPTARWTARAAGEDLAAGADPLARFAARRPGAWSAEAGTLVARGPADAFASLDGLASFPAGSALRARFVPGPGASLFLRVARRDGRSDEALLGPDGAFLTLGGGDGGLARVPRVRLVPGRRTEAIFEARGGRSRLWLDGWLVHEAEDPTGGGPGGVGIGVRGGEVRVEALEVIGPAEAPAPGPPSR